MLIAKLPQNNKNATAYIRVSSQRQVDKGVSIDAQKRRIKEYAFSLAGPNTSSA